MASNRDMNRRGIPHCERPVRIWTNPIDLELDELPDAVRFTAVHSVKEVYLWKYSLACHTDISTCLHFRDTYDSPNFLKGAAIRQHDDRFIMFQSHYLESFKRNRLTRQERSILSSLLAQDWSWLNQCVEVTSWLEAFRKRVWV